MFSAGAVYGLAGYRVSGESVALVFPMRDGAYVVGHGGATPLVNYHNVHPSQRFALDIIGLNRLGLWAWGLYPSNLDRYVIFGDTVFSPCAGSVVRANDGLEVSRPPGRDQE